MCLHVFSGIVNEKLLTDYLHHVFPSTKPGPTLASLRSASPPHSLSLCLPSANFCMPHLFTLMALSRIVNVNTKGAPESTSESEYRNARRIVLH